MATTKNPKVLVVDATKAGEYERAPRSMTRSDLRRVAGVIEDRDLHELFVSIGDNNGLEMGQALNRIVARLKAGSDDSEIVTNLKKFLKTVS